MNAGENIRAEHGLSAENEALLRERFNSLSRLVPVLYVAISIDSILLSWLFRDAIPLWVNALIALTALVIIVGRGIYWYRLRGKAYILDLPQIRGAIRGTAIFGPILSLAFSTVGFFLMEQGNAAQRSVTLIAIWIVASASSFCVFSLPLTAMLILLMSCVPMCLTVLLSGDLQVMMEAPAFIGVAALMVYVVRENHRNFTEIVNSRSKMKRLQDELGQNHKHLEIAQKVGEIGSAEVNLVTGAMTWSDQFYRLLDLDRATVAPSMDAFVASVHPDDRELVRDVVVKSSQGLNAAPIEFRVFRADGTVSWFSGASDVLLSDKGVAEGLIATIHDITERKRTEAQHLELMLQLSHAQKMEAVGHLTGGVAHDFNNLLGVILGRLQMLDEELADRPELQGWVRSSLKAVHRGATLTKSLIAFSRRQALMPIELDLNATIDAIEDMLRQTLGEAYEFRIVKGHRLWRVEVDPGQLQSALLNLVLNARDAMLKGGTLIIETSNATLDADYASGQNDVRPGEYALLSVSDNGLGMSREVAERAFEPFFTTKDVNKGSGLGLSMVYGFVKQSGGHVTIESESGMGTTIRIYLPRKGEPILYTPSQRIEAGSAAGGHETILVVEDNDDLRELTRLQLERMGYTVLEAMHGAEGLRVLRANPGVDLLLTDVVMPLGMSGPDLAEQAIVGRPNLRVVFMSGYSEQRDTLERTRGPVRMLQKPFHIDELAAQIRAALD